MIEVDLDRLRRVGVLSPGEAVTLGKGVAEIEAHRSFREEISRHFYGQFEEVAEATGAKNYVEHAMVYGDKRFTITIRPESGKTQGELVNEAEAEIERLRGALTAITSFEDHPTGIIAQRALDAKPAKAVIGSIVWPEDGPERLALDLLVERDTWRFTCWLMAWETIGHLMNGCSRCCRRHRRAKL